MGAVEFVCCVVADGAGCEGVELVAEKPEQPAALNKVKAKQSVINFFVACFMGDSSFLQFILSPFIIRV
mgnify:CR=1 FL=1